MRRLAVYLPHPLPIWRLPQGYIERIRRSAGKRFDLDLPANEAGLVKVLPEVEVLYAWGLAQRLVSQATKLRWIHTPLTGVDRLLDPGAGVRNEGLGGGAHHEDGAARRRQALARDAGRDHGPDGRRPGAGAAADAGDAGPVRRAPAAPDEVVRDP